MTFNNDIKEEVRSRNDIVSVVSQYVKLKRTGSSYVGLCPFHNENSPSFSVNPQRQMYHCFGCNESGDVFRFVEKYENYTFLEALKYLADRAGMQLPNMELSAAEKQKASIKQKLFEIQKKAAGYYYYVLTGPVGKKGLDYFEKRGLSKETIMKFGLGFSDTSGSGLYKYLRNQGYDDDILSKAGLFVYDEKKGPYDKFWNRVMFPIMDINNKVIAFGGRVLSDAKPKYLNSPETMLFEKSRNLYGINYARISRKGYFIICEGYMDVISLHQAGYDCAVAPLGTALTPLQAKLIKRYVDTVYISFDSDEAGTKAALRSIPIFKDAGLSTKIINLKPYKDPDELIKAIGVEGYQNRIDEAINSFYFEAQVEAVNHDLSDPESKMSFLNTMARKLLSFPEEVERNVYADAFAKKYDVDSKEFRRLINHLGANVVAGAKEESFVERRVKKDNTESAIKRSQRLLLTWLGDDSGLFDKIEGIIDANDFKDPLYNRAATILFEQYKREGKVTPVQIPGYFDDDKEKDEVARMFTADLKAEILVDWMEDNEKELTPKIKERALNQLVFRIKSYSIEEELRDAKDMQTIRNATLKKMELTKMHISL